MSNEELNNRLYEKLRAEQDAYKAWLLAQSPEVILQRAREYVVRETTVSVVKSERYPNKMARRLLNAEHFLSDIYTAFVELNMNNRVTVT